MHAIPDARIEFEEHPAARLFPLMSDDELHALVNRMTVHGYDPEQPILLYQGMLLDGRNRKRAAEIAGVKPLFRVLPENTDPFQEAAKLNLERRNLKPGQKAAIIEKITAASAQWQTEQQERIRAANQARAEKLTGVPRAERRSSNEDPLSETKPDNRTVTALAAKAGVSRPTMERARKLKKEDPERFEALARGEKHPRKKPAARVDHPARADAVKGLHEEGHGTFEIARRLKLPSAEVSKIKSALGIAGNSPSVKLWKDVQHIAAQLDGARAKIIDVTSSLDPAELSVGNEEIHACLRNLSKSASAVNRLRAVLRTKLHEH